MRYCHIRNATTGEPVLDRAAMATSLWSRFWGLMGRRRTGDDFGMLIEPCSSIHTMFMRFTIDVVFLDRERRVLKVATVPPFRVSLARGTKSVLELASGVAERLGIEAGHQLEVVPIPDG